MFICMHSECRCVLQSNVFNSHDPQHKNKIARDYCHIVRRHIESGFPFGIKILSSASARIVLVRALVANAYPLLSPHLIPSNGFSNNILRTKQKIVIASKSNEKGNQNNECEWMS